MEVKDRLVYRNRYTLLELLITMTLILILFAILCPCFKCVLNAARLTTCVNNLKTLGYAFSMYTADFNMLLPHKDNGDTQPPFGCIWYTAIDRYLNTVSDDFYKFKQDPSYIYFHNRDIKKTFYSYKFNSRLEDYKGIKSCKSAPFRNISSLKHPSLTVLVFDGRADKGYKTKPYGIYTAISARHTRISNILFCDFHVSKRKTKSGDQTKVYGWRSAGGLYWDPDVPLEYQK